MIHHDTSMYGGPLSSFVFPHFPGTCGRQKARHNTFRWISFHWAMNSYDYGNWQTTTRCCRWQSLQCSKSSKERCQLAVAAEALATSPWQNSTSMFANQPTENKYLNYLNRYLLETKKRYDWIAIFLYTLRRLCFIWLYSVQGAAMRVSLPGLSL